MLPSKHCRYSEASKPARTSEPSLPLVWAPKNANQVHVPSEFSWVCLCAFFLQAHEGVITNFTGLQVHGRLESMKYGQPKKALTDSKKRGVEILFESLSSSKSTVSNLEFFHPSLALPWTTFQKLQDVDREDAKMVMSCQVLVSNGARAASITCSMNSNVPSV